MFCRCHQMPLEDVKLDFCDKYSLKLPYLKKFITEQVIMQNLLFTSFNHVKPLFPPPKTDQELCFEALTNV